MRECKYCLEKDDLLPKDGVCNKCKRKMVDDWFIKYLDHHHQHPKTDSN